MLVCLKVHKLLRQPSSTRTMKNTTNPPPNCLQLCNWKEIGLIWIKVIMPLLVGKWIHMDFMCSYFREIHLLWDTSSYVSHLWWRLDIIMLVGYAVNDNQKHATFSSRWLLVRDEESHRTVNSALILVCDSVLCILGSFPFLPHVITWTPITK